MIAKAPENKAIPRPERGKLYTPDEFRQFIPQTPVVPNWEDGDPKALELAAAAEATRAAAERVTNAWVMAQKSGPVQLEQDLMAEREEREAAYALANGALHRYVRDHYDRERQAEYEANIAAAALTQKKHIVDRRGRIAKFFGRSA